jgi:hypothetical protein
MSTLGNFPENGFYRHYKYDAEGDLNNYTYEVLGVGRNTEDDMLVVIYRPLYGSAWMAPATHLSRPLEMFMEHVTKDGKSVPRFSRVRDSGLISKLEQIRTQMYVHKK